MDEGDEWWLGTSKVCPQGLSSKVTCDPRRMKPTRGKELAELR